MKLYIAWFNVDVIIHSCLISLSDYLRLFEKLQENNYAHKDASISVCFHMVFTSNKASYYETSKSRSWAVG